MTARHFLRRLQIACAASVMPIAAATIVSHGTAPGGKSSSRIADTPLLGWLALPFLLLASVCAAAPERGREASLDLQGLRGRSAHVVGELLQIHACRNFAFEHALDGVAPHRASLSEPAREVSDESGAR